MQTDSPQGQAIRPIGNGDISILKRHGHLANRNPDHSSPAYRIDTLPLQ